MMWSVARPLWFGILLAVVLCTLCSFSAARADEYRAFWIDAWGAGLLNQSQVDKLLGVPGDPNSKGDIRNANCNTVFVQVRRRADVCYPSAMGEPYFSGLTPSNFNALQAIINAAHDTTGGKQRIEVHCWIVAFAMAGNNQIASLYYQHNNPADPDNYWMTLDENGNETDDKALDPGHPKCQDYITNVCMDLVQNFDIDGIHYDYIRFTANNQGYNPTSIARYNARYNLTGKPLPADEQFKQWRRDQVSALVRKVYAKIQAVKPWVKQSGSFVTWNPSPTSSTRAGFQGTRPYYDVYSDWDSWIQEGIVDMAVPMTYYDNASLPSDYTRWINFEKDRKGSRHMIIGPGIYLNYLQDAINQLLATRTPSPSGKYADGFSGYSYRCPYTTVKPTGSQSRVYGTWANFSPQLISQVTPTPANIPAMPWKVSPTRGHISGNITYAQSGAWADGATVSITGPESRTQACDGTGFYAFIDLTPGTYTITVSKTAYPSAQRNVTVAIGSVTGNMYLNNFTLGGSNPPVISNIQASNITNGSATISWSTDQASSTRVDYGLTSSYGSSTPLDSNQVTSHVANLSGLSPNTTYHFRVISANSYGSTQSTDYTFQTSGPPSISGAASSDITATSATVTWNTDAPADGRVNYGTSSSYGSQATDPNIAASHTVSITGLAPSTTYHFQCVSQNAYGTAQTGDYTFTTLPVSTEIVIDNTDPGWSNTSSNGNTWTAKSLAGVLRIGSNYLYAKGDGSLVESSSTTKCRWTPNLSAAGLYDVYVYYQIGFNRNSAAPYTVYHYGGQVTSVQNQCSATSSGGWFLVAQNVPFLAGTGGYVELTTLSTDTNLVSADAAKWVLKSISDITPPAMTTVTDEKYTASTTTLNASWSSFEPDSGVSRYEYSVGTNPEGTDVKSWTNAGTATSAAIGGLSLSLGQTYYINVRAFNASGLVSNVMSSSGVRTARSVPSVAQAKKYPDGEVIALPGLAITAKFAGRFYLQDADRTSGLRVESSTGLPVNQQVKVYGVLGLADGCERAILDPKVEPGSTGSAARALLMKTKSLGGMALNSYTPGVFGVDGLNNIGLLVRVTGKVTAVVSDGFYVDDGSGASDGSSNVGIKVWTGTSNSVSQNSRVGVTGIVSCRISGTRVYPQVLMTGITNL